MNDYIWLWVCLHLLNLLWKFDVTIDHLNAKVLRKWNHWKPSEVQPGATFVMSQNPIFEPQKWETTHSNKTWDLWVPMVCFLGGFFLSERAQFKRPQCGVLFLCYLLLEFKRIPHILTHNSPTLPTTSIAPENMPSQKETSIPTIYFQVRTVSFREGIHQYQDVGNFLISKDSSPPHLRTPNKPMEKMKVFFSPEKMGCNYITPKNVWIRGEPQGHFLQPGWTHIHSNPF